MKKFMRDLALPIAILVTASELNCLSTSVSLASSFNDGNEGIHSIVAIEDLPDIVAHQKLTVGASEDEIFFPDTLKVTVENICEKKVTCNPAELKSGADASVESSEDNAVEQNSSAGNTATSGVSNSAGSSNSTNNNAFEHILFRGFEPSIINRHKRN